MTPTPKNDLTPRWQQRFNHFEKALANLAEASEEMRIRSFSTLEKEGLIQRFELVCELSWKVLKDYLEFENIKLERVTPNWIIKEAFSNKIISGAELMLSALQDRNLLSHTYDDQKMEEIVIRVQTHYVNLFQQLQSQLRHHANLKSE